MHNLTGKTALVTGGATGIGEAIALALAEAGAEVFITYRSHVPSKELTLGINKIGDTERQAAFCLDSTAERNVTDLAAEFRQRGIAFDILVNNIGGLIRRSTIADMSFDLWRQVMSVNLDSAFLLTHHFLPLIRPRGRIINISSLAGRNGGHPGATAYATSKAALFGFTRGLSKELAPQGITVNALAPGFIDGTPFHSTHTTTESRNRTIETIPLGRAGLPADVAAAAVWLASEGSAFVTGTITDINGGQFFG